MLERDKCLQRFHSYGTFAKAKYFYEINQSKDYFYLLDFLKQYPVPCTFIGRGSNVIFKDDYYPGLLIVNKLNNYLIDGTTVIAESGVNLPLLARKVAKHNLSGLEQLVGVPGTVGGSVFMNAGISGYEISIVLKRLKC